MKWTYTLDDTVDPLLRLGIHGLWRYAQYYAPNGMTATKDAVTVEWETVEDLNRLLSQTAGDFSKGFATPPGYVDDVTDARIYATILAHKGITQIFRARKGASRGTSLGVSNSQKIQLLDNPWATEEKESKLTLGYVPWTLEGASPPTMEVSTSKKKAGQLSPNQKLGNLFHPGLAMWNGKSQEAPPQEMFAMAFSCLAHVFFADGSLDKGMVGLGIDAPTFEEADALHDLWMTAPILRAPTEEIGLWAVATALDLPQGTYIKIGDTGCFPFTIDKAPYELLRPCIGSPDKARQLQETPTTHKGYDALTYVIRNVQAGRAWYTGINPATPYPSVKAMFTEMLKDPMEKKIVEGFRKIRASLAHQYAKRYGTPIGSGYDRADQFMVNTHLNRAKNRTALLKALSVITREANRGFNSEELNWILERSKTHCAEVQSLLILACTTFNGPAKDTTIEFE